MFQVGITCYASKLLANNAIASGELGRIVTMGGNPYLVNVSGVSETAIEYTFNPVSGGSAITQAVLSDPIPCGLLSIPDATPIVWAVVAGWVAIYCVKLLLIAKDAEK